MWTEVNSDWRRVECIWKEIEPGYMWGRGRMWRGQSLLEVPRGLEETSLKSRDSFSMNIKSEQDIQQEVNMSFVPKLHQAHQEWAMPHGVCVTGRKWRYYPITGPASLTSFSTWRLIQKTERPVQCPETTDKDDRWLHTIIPRHLHRLLSFSFLSPTHFWIFFLHNSSKPPFSLRVTAFLVSPSVTSTSKKRGSSSRTNLLTRCQNSLCFWFYILARLRTPKEKLYISLCIQQRCVNSILQHW